jgi:hypothetical protein
LCLALDLVDGGSGVMVVVVNVWVKRGKRERERGEGKPVRE